ncbi:hypothetical protein JMUB7507_26390 [Staphylococcus aureus]
MAKYKGIYMNPRYRLDVGGADDNRCTARLNGDRVKGLFL